MCWFRKKKCDHDWHYLSDDWISEYDGYQVGCIRGKKIYCPKCKAQRTVTTKQWQEIRRMKEIDGKQLDEVSLIITYLQKTQCNNTLLAKLLKLEEQINNAQDQAEYHYLYNKQVELIKNIF